MTFAVVTNWDAGYAAVAAVTAPRVAAYAKARRYAAAVTHAPGHYGKVEALLAAWGAADWLFWLDADAVVTNPKIDLAYLARPDADFVLTCDRVGLNTGAVLVRCCAAARTVLDGLIACRPEFDHPPLHDQNGFAHALWKCKERVAILPQRAMNSYPDHPLVERDAVWRPGDFVLHCPGLPPEEKVRYLEASA
jgi:hypothetical protein